MRLAFFSPLNPQPSGISDYSEELLPALADDADIDLYTADGVTPSTPAILERFAWFPHTRFAGRHAERPYDLCLYQIGNNTACHAYMDAYIQQYPGIVTLHDYTLHHLYADMFGRTARYDDYQAMMHRYYGTLGRQIAERFRQGIRNDYVYYQLPAYQRVVEPSLGTIVHSRYVRHKLLRYNPAYRVAHIPMGVALPDIEAVDAAVLRTKYGIPRDAFVVTSPGFLIEGKRLRELLHAFAQFAQEAPEAVCILAGRESEAFDVRAEIEALGLTDKVRVTGYVPYADYFDYLALSDACVSLRYPTVRATSANILKIMAQGKPVLVSELAELMDLPDSACLKIPLDEREIPCLLDTFRRLYRDQDYRQTVGHAARQYVATRHTIKQAAGLYANFCHQIVTKTFS